MQQIVGQTSATRPGGPIDDYAPVNRFSVTIRVGYPKTARRMVEVLRQSQYERCQHVEAEVVRDHGRVVAVTGFSFRNYDSARAVAELHLRKLQAQPA